MTRIKQSSIYATVAVIASLTGTPVLAQDIPPGWNEDWAKCGNNLPGGKFPLEVVIHACTGVINNINIKIYRLTALEIRASTYAELGDDRRAIADFTESIRLDPKNGAETYRRRAASYKRLGSYDLAIADLSKTIQYYRKLPRMSQWMLAPPYSDRGDIYNVREQYNEAIADFTKAIRETSFAPAYEGRCFSYLKKKNYDLALSDCNTAIRLIPESPQAYELRAEIYSVKGQTKLATADSNEAVRLKTVNKVLACYKVGNATVADMYACAGVWVTPRTLTLCFLEADCPVIRDTINARSVVDAALDGPDKLDTKISIDMKNVLSVPDRKVIEECKGAGADAATECVAPKMAPASLKPLMDCGAINDDTDKARCLTKGAPKELSSVVECLSTKGTGTAAFSECTANRPWLPWAKVQDVQNCVSGAAGNAKLDCLLAWADLTQKALAACLSSSSDRAAVALDCLTKSNPQMAEKIAVATCAAKAVDAQAATTCFTTVMGGDGAKIAACALGGKEKMVSCLLPDKPEYKAASQLVACAQGGRDASSLVANCSDFLVKDQKTRAVLACAAQAGSDSSKLVGCAASSVLPPAVARFAGCAATSQGPTSFALCAAGPMMNEEWRVAAECAVQTGGNPAGFAGCTSGRLTLKELRQCFNGGSCFGPNNTIVQYYTNAFEDVLHGPGANNEIVVALRKLGEATGGPNSVINNPGQVFGGEGSVFHNPGQILGGEHSVLNEFFEEPFGGDCSFFNRPAGC